jgi:hypothetical protein
VCHWGSAAYGVFAYAYAGPNDSGIVEGTWLRVALRVVFVMMNLDREEEE